MVNTIIDAYRTVFGAAPPVVVRSPGRLNIIGEHTDYNDGFVLPAAINKYIYVCAGLRDDQEIHLYAADFKETVVCVLEGLAPHAQSWVNYVLGVADQLLLRGHAVQGFNLALGGDVPLGAGLSSSAAVECGAIFALDHLFGFHLERIDMVLMAQQAEHKFAGVHCGVMDMYASVFGRKGQAMQLDCRSLTHRYVPLDLGNYTMLLLNTNVKHSLASTEYNTRRQQCEQGVAWVQVEYPTVHSLRDVDMDMLDRCVAPRDATVYQRCRYVLEENERLLHACADLERGDLAALGQCMYGSHKGLSRVYEVSCPELDFLVDFVRTRPEVLGARMMGGGFGGCTINLVRADAVDALVASAAEAYAAQMGRVLTAHVVDTGDGTQVLSPEQLYLP